jgi:hypothetical protein
MKFVFAAAAAMLACAPAAAVTMSYDETVALDGFQQAIFEGFASSKGTLTNVRVSYDYAFTYTGSLGNSGAEPVDESGSIYAFVSFMTPDGYFDRRDNFRTYSVSFSSYETAEFSGWHGDGTGEFDVAAGSYIDTNPTLQLLPFGVSHQPDGPFSQIYSMLMFDDPTAITGAITLTYTYEAAETGTVPEPASWAMMVAGFGLIGAGLRGRQRMRAPA